MAINSVLQTIRNAEIDARSLSEFMYKPASFMVVRRLASPIHTLSYYLDWLESVLINIGFVVKGTFADGATLNSPFDVVADSQGNLYRWGGTLPKTVSSGSTPQNTGGFGATAWIEVSDAALRSELQSSTGAGLVGIDINGNYVEGTVGHAVARRRVNGVELLPLLNKDSDSGEYYVVFAPDAPFNGTAKVDIYTTSENNVFGTCILTKTSRDGVAAEQAVSICRLGVWSEFYTSPALDGGLIPVSDAKKFKIGTGGYSWWNEPQSITIGGTRPRTLIGSVDDVNKYQKIVVADTSKDTPESHNVYLRGEGEVLVDEHNAPVTTIAGDTLVTFAPAHEENNYIPYWVSKTKEPTDFGEMKKLMSTSGGVSYSQVHYSTLTKKLYVFFRSNSTQSWYMAQSADWFADEPDWQVDEILTNTGAQLYVKFCPTGGGVVIRFMCCKNPKNRGTNGLWFGYLNVQDNSIKTAGGSAVGTIGESVVHIDSLEKVYDAPNNLRMYDVMSLETAVAVLFHDVDVEADGAPYKFILYRISTWSVEVESDIVQSGKTLGYNYYYGGAHFGNVRGFGNTDLNSNVGYVYTAREQGGTWYVEKWESTDNYVTWSKVAEIDKSTTQELWRPRVPYDARLYDTPNNIEVTWCKGNWRNFAKYDGEIWALRK